MNERAITFKIDEDVHDQISKVADKNYRSLSAQVRLILYEWVKEKGPVTGDTVKGPREE